VYEFRLRPEDKQHQPWIDRVRGQLAEAYRLLEVEAATAPATPWLFGARPLQADVTAAVAWSFTASVLPDTIAADDHPALAALTRRAEATPAFLATPIA
jgi:glutathione S-transferase